MGLCALSGSRRAGGEPGSRLSLGGGARAPAARGPRRDGDRGAGASPGAQGLGLPRARGPPPRVCRLPDSACCRKSAPPYLEPCSGERAAETRVSPAGPGAVRRQEEQGADQHAGWEEEKLAGPRGPGELRPWPSLPSPPQPLVTHSSRAVCASPGGSGGPASLLLSPPSGHAPGQQGSLAVQLVRTVAVDLGRGSKAGGGRGQRRERSRDRN